MKIIPDMWNYANAAYREPECGHGFVLPTEMIRFWSAKRGVDFAFISEESRRVVISFRGTDTAGGNWKAWISNLDAIDGIHDKLNPGIHDGFAECAHEYYTDVRYSAAMAAIDKRPIILTGHSRGAAVASITALMLQRDGFKNISVIVFGCPRWCNVTVRNEFDQTEINCTRVATSFDIVPTLPPHALGFRAAGKEYELKTNPFLPIPCIMKFLRGCMDHVPKTYTRCLSTM